MENNNHYAYCYKVVNGSIKRVNVEKRMDRRSILDFAVSRKSDFEFVMVVTEKQREQRDILDKFYQVAYRNKGITVFFEPPMYYLKDINVSLSYFNYLTRNV